MLLLVAVVLVLFVIANQGGRSVNAISCDANEQTAVHYHAHLTLLNEGNEVSVPANIGIPPSGGCLYWLHTHNTDGVIHIEGPTSQQNRTFTLGDLFAVWGQPLSPTQVATLPVDKNHQVTAFVDGKPYTGDLKSIQLHRHTQVVIEIGPPVTDPPPSYTFAAGL